MDYLHPVVGVVVGSGGGSGVGGGMGGGIGIDDDSLFSAYLHPPMVLQEDSPGVA